MHTYQSTQRTRVEQAAHEPYHRPPIVLISHNNHVKVRRLPCHLWIYPFGRNWQHAATRTGWRHASKTIALVPSQEIEEDARREVDAEGGFGRHAA